ncbi:uncharacterized protein LOC110710616 [Chenopodium quinoa]|uniref:uncharacterized protein LOC110710616 n=1 Tax=Chenopodium quinoa TaxID=63459 RepID=UPI000B78A700|nr:uncharacterized protein LOC110710616 [Chenopodium quinoa]
MLLCPTLSPTLAPDLVPALSCAMVAAEYDWCTLVLSKLLSSVRSFARRFYSCGNAGGCGGCILFAVIFYLDRLDREAVQWGVFPRLKVWTMKEITIASKEDRSPNGGDYGCLGTLDVAYGEVHPRQARDTNGPGVVSNVVIEDDIDCTSGPKRRRGASSSKLPRQGIEFTDVIESRSGVTVVSEGVKPTEGKIEVGFVDLPFVGNVDNCRRFLSVGSLSLLRNMISLLLRGSNWFFIRDWPHLLSRAFLEVKSFDAASDYNIVMLPSLSAFIGNPRCPVLVVVSKVHLSDRRSSSCAPVMHRICIALKTIAGSEMMLLSADSITKDINLV